ncbi:MAG: biotin/lipoyl-binding protein, partial [Pirellulaceae bacterium]
MRFCRFLAMAGWFTSLVLVGGCSDKAEVAEAKIRPVKTMLLDASASTQSRTYPGTVKASQEVTLAFQVAGPLIELPFKEGQEVEKGEVLARIDPRDFKTRVAKTASAVAEARATLAAMKSARPEDIRLLESHIEEANAVLT